MVIVQNGIALTISALAEYDKLIEHDIPWNEFKQSLDIIDKFRNDDATERDLLINELRMHLMNAIDEHFYASQSLYEFASVAAVHLKLYLKLFDDYDLKKADTQKQLFIGVLDNGMAALNGASAELGNSSFSLHLAGGRIIALKQEFGEKSNVIQKRIAILAIGSNQPEDAINNRLTNMSDMLKFYNNLEQKVKQTIAKIIRAKEILQNYLDEMSVLKSNAQKMVSFVHLDKMRDMYEMTISLAQQLITVCEYYHKQHNNRS